MRSLVYLLSGLIFGFGLSLSGMIDPLKVKSFLSVGVVEWNPALIFVLGSAVAIYLIFFLILRRKKRTLSGLQFNHPTARPVDKNLVLGAVLFGIGWGIVGICPGPALVHLSFLDLHFAVFIAMMIAGFELQRRIT